MINEQELLERASHKAFAKVMMLGMDVERLRDDIKIGNTGGVTTDELLLMLEGSKVELQVWELIAELIEKSNKE